MTVKLELKKISMKFGELYANKNISIKFENGKVHALLGENGAGKSTLMNTIFGLNHGYTGDIILDGKVIQISNTNSSFENKIGMVHQHFKLVEKFNAVQNIILGREETSFFLNYSKPTKKINEILSKYNLVLDLNKPVSAMSVADKQKVEIIKLLYQEMEILIFDEPTAVLMPNEIDSLMDIIEELKKEGKTIIFISHKINEINKIADYCTVIRSGKKISTYVKKDFNDEKFIIDMVGENIEFSKNTTKPTKNTPLLKFENVTYKTFDGSVGLNNFSLEINEGEILGLAGVSGNGQNHLVDILLGKEKVDSGKVFFKGNDITNKSNEDIIKSGIGIIPEDRHKFGLMLSESITTNINTHNIFKPEYKNGRFIDDDKLLENTKVLIDKYDIRCSGPHQIVRELSGGNQQKVIIAREIENNPELLIVFQPTRGVDLGAISNIHKFLIDYKNKGKTILLISYELEEVIALSNRAAIILDGKITKLLDSKITSHEIGKHMGKGE